MDETVTIDLKYLNELKTKAKAWDNYLKEEEARAEEDIKLIFSASFHQLVDERVKEIKNKFMEDE